VKVTFFSEKDTLLERVIRPQARDDGNKTNKRKQNPRSSAMNSKIMKDTIQDMEVVTNSSSSPMTNEEDIHFDGLRGGEDDYTREQEVQSHSNESGGSIAGSESESHSNSGSSSNGSGRTGSLSDRGDHLFSKAGLMYLAGARCCFIFTLLVAAVVMAAVVFISLNENQTDEFISEVS
jgi:hypothetical protein